MSEEEADRFIGTKHTWGTVRPVCENAELGIVRQELRSYYFSVNNGHAYLGCYDPVTGREV